MDRETANNAEISAIVHLGNLPVLHRHNALLSEVQETIVKAIYLAGGMYVSDIKMMMAFSAEVQSIERAIKDLDEDGYLIKAKNVYGVLLGLTKEGVEQIKRHPKYISDGLEVNVQEMDVLGENAFMKHKCISFAVADYVFRTRLQTLWDKFWATDIYVRNHYLAKQFLKQIAYRDYLELAPDKREQFLADAELTEKEKELFPRNEKYIVWNATKFSELVFIHMGFESVKKMDGYHEYMQMVKRGALNEPNNNTFYLLKDMLTEAEKQGYQELQLLWRWKCSILKFGAEKLRNGLSGTEELILKERRLDTANRYLFLLQNERRSLINSNAYKKRDNEKELGEALVKLAELDSAVDSIRKQKEELETDFSFAVLKSYDGSENDYELKVLNLQRLAQNGMYVSVDASKNICLYVMQTKEEYFDLFSLHKKMAMGLQLIKRLAPYSSVQVRIITYNADQQEFIERTLPALVKKLLESRETAFYANQFEEICSIQNTLEGPKERYIFFKAIIKEMKGDCLFYEKKRSDGASEEGSD
mgnify:FL=1